MYNHRILEIKCLNQILRVTIAIRAYYGNVFCLMTACKGIVRISVIKDDRPYYTERSIDLKNLLMSPTCNYN